MIAIELVTETVLNRGTFMPAAQAVTGQNHVSAADSNPGISRLVDDLRVLEDFSGNTVGTAIIHLGFLAAGFSDEVTEFIAHARGMAHVPTYQIERQGIRCVLISGSLDQWKTAVVEGTHDQSVVVREAYNKVFQIVTQLGLGSLFYGYRPTNHADGTFLLEQK